jgi:hypothetical protein
VECFTIWSFLQRCLDDQWLIHASIQAALSPDLCNNVVNADIVGCLQLRETTFLNFFEFSDSEQLSQQLFTGLRLYEDDQLIPSIMKIDTAVVERCLCECHI